MQDHTCHVSNLSVKNMSRGHAEVAEIPGNKHKNSVHDPINRKRSSDTQDGIFEAQKWLLSTKKMDDSFAQFNLPSKPWECRAKVRSLSPAQRAPSVGDNQYQ